MNRDDDPADVRGPAHGLLSWVVRVLLAANALLFANIRRPVPAGGRDEGVAVER